MNVPSRKYLYPSLFVPGSRFLVFCPTIPINSLEERLGFQLNRYEFNLRENDDSIFLDSYYFMMYYKL